MIVNCKQCKVFIKRKPSECGENNFCSRKCLGVFRKNSNDTEKYINKITK